MDSHKWRTPKPLPREPAFEPPAAAEALARVWAASDLGLVVFIAAAACVLHLITASRYGYFRDELYYAACGQHLAWGYVDHAPLIAVILVHAPAARRFVVFVTLLPGAFLRRKNSPDRMDGERSSRASVLRNSSPQRRCSFARFTSPWTIFFP